MTEYLYGASVQGIQSFIFQTNKLKEIIGASQLVDDIFNDEFITFCKEENIDKSRLDIIMSAAGGIRLIANQEQCEKIVKSFPMRINNFAPGVTLSQAIVKHTGNLDDDIKLLESQLKIQRNQPEMPIDIGFMGLKRARRTGGVAIEKDKDQTFVDRATQKKNKKPETQTLALFRKFSGDQKVLVKDIPFDMADITRDHENGWLAIVHADGNGIGLLLKNMKLGEGEDKKQFYTDFSEAIDRATLNATKSAYNAVIIPTWEEENRLNNTPSRKPLRPVILGGDDLTLIIRADLAFDFTKKYLLAFEEATKVEFKKLRANYKILSFEEKLTACAGIAYIKESYPFHYGVHLAENLTGETKTFLKNANDGKAPSALNFYKVQASFIDDLSSMKKRTHFAKASNISFDYGPYLITESLPDVAEIKELDKALDFLLQKENKNSKPVAKLRQWSAELHKDQSKAAFLKQRMKQVNSDLYQRLDLENIIKENKSKVNDLLILSSF